MIPANAINAPQDPESLAVGSVIDTYIDDLWANCLASGNTPPRAQLLLEQGRLVIAQELCDLGTDFGSHHIVNALQTRLAARAQAIRVPNPSVAYDGLIDPSCLDATRRPYPERMRYYVLAGEQPASRQHDFHLVFQGLESMASLALEPLFRQGNAALFERSISIGERITAIEQALAGWPINTLGSDDQLRELTELFAIPQASLPPLERASYRQYARTIGALRYRYEVRRIARQSVGHGELEIVGSRYVAKEQVMLYPTQTVLYANGYSSAMPDTWQDSLPTNNRPEPFGALGSRHGAAVLNGETTATPAINVDAARRAATHALAAEEAGHAPNSLPALAELHYALTNVYKTAGPHARLALQAELNRNLYAIAAREARFATTPPPMPIRWPRTAKQPLFFPNGVAMIDGAVVNGQRGRWFLWPSGSATREKDGYKRVHYTPEGKKR